MICRIVSLLVAVGFVLIACAQPTPTPMPTLTIAPSPTPSPILLSTVTAASVSTPIPTPTDAQWAEAWVSIWDGDNGVTAAVQVGYSIPAGDLVLAMMDEGGERCFRSMTNERVHPSGMPIELSIGGLDSCDPDVSHGEITDVWISSPRELDCVKHESSTESVSVFACERP